MVAKVLFPYRVVFFQILCCIFLSTATNFSNEDDAFSLWILKEHLQTIYEVCAIERISPNT